VIENQTISKIPFSNTFAYDTLGWSAGTVLIGAGQTLDFDALDFTLAGVSALDKYVIEETPSWKEESDLGLSAHGVPDVWWDCSASVTRLPGQGAVTSSVIRVQLTGLSPSDAETWARFEDGTPAIAVRKNAFGGNEVFLGTPACPPELVRALVDLAGVHRYVKDGHAAIWATEGRLSVMADEQGGKVTFDTGVAGQVTDFFTGEKVADGPVFTLDMVPGETRLFESRLVP